MQAPVIFQQIDTTPVLDTASTNIPASASSALQVVSALAEDCTSILASSQSDQFIGIYADAQPRPACIVPPGWNDHIGVSLKAGQKISVRNMQNTVINTGLICLQFANS